jgi:hypothetical protein
MLIVLFATFVVCMLIFVLSFLYNFQIMFADIYIYFHLVMGLIM